MDDRKPLKVFILASYGPSYEVLKNLIRGGVRPDGVIFSPLKVQRLGWKKRIENVIAFRELREPKLLLKKYGIPYYFVLDHNSSESEAILKAANPDLILLYGTRIIKPNILEIPRVGTLNAHSSILPKYRGSKSEFWILSHGDFESAGVTIHWVTPGLDEGDIFLQQSIAVDANETPRSLREKSRPLAGELFAKAIRSIESGNIIRIHQDESRATKFKKPTSEELEAFKKKPSGRIDKAVGWLLGSGAQNLPGSNDIKGVDISGSFNAWFNPNARTHTYAYTEISGYALTSLVHLYQEFKQPEILKQAILVGEWLLSIQTPDGAFPTAFYKVTDAPQKPAEYHAFDVGMVLNGLVCLYRETKDARYLESAQRAADWLVSFQYNVGSLPATVDEKGKVKDHAGTWSTQSGPYHTKIAMGFLNLYDIVRDERYKAAAVKLCEYALIRQTPEGQFLTYGELWGTNLHPHLYTAEGLFAAAEYLNEPKYKEAAERSVRWALDASKDGIVPRHKQNENFNYNERVDVLAQAYRMARLLEIEHPALEPLLGRIAGYQSFADDTRQYGGFVFGKSSTGDALPHVNTWVTMFAIQALMLAPGWKKFNYFYLV